MKVVFAEEVGTNRQYDPPLRNAILRTRDVVLDDEGGGRLVITALDRSRSRSPLTAHEPLKLRLSYDSARVLAMQMLNITERSLMENTP